MPRPPVEVADIVRAAGESVLEDSRKWITRLHLKAVNALRCAVMTSDGGYGFRLSRSGTFSNPQPGARGPFPVHRAQLA